MRVGVHTGPAVMRGCDWYGAAVNVAARLAAQAEPNEALVSASTRAAARGASAPALAAPVDYVFRGTERPVRASRLA